MVSGGYIRVLQDIRGKHGSEGDYVMNRPLHGPLNSTAVDHSTDTYDTIDWLVKNVAESNGKVGILGISYDGFTSLMALVNPHPALRAAVPINAMVDGWMGDDWFHKGAFRQDSLRYFHDQEATRGSDIHWWSDHYDDYDTWLAAGSAGEMAKLHGLDQVGFNNKVMSHPAYDSFWQDQALDKILGDQGLAVPTMLVHSLWDQEDIYGNIALYKSLKAHHPDQANLYLVLGPWFHHQERLEGDRIGDIKWGSDTAAYFRLHVLRPFLDHFLKDEAPPLSIAPVTAFESGTDRWEDLPTWPAGCPSGCSIDRARLYFQPGGGLGFTSPGGRGVRGLCVRPCEARALFAETDPYRGRRRIDLGDLAGERSAGCRGSHRCLELHDGAARGTAEDERRADRESGGLDDGHRRGFRGEGDRRVPGRGGARSENGRLSAHDLGGHPARTLPRLLQRSEAHPPGEAQVFRFALPTANHVFLPGHRVMVQVQSSWFPLYDRNPQSYVPNIFFAKPSDYQKATVKVFDGAGSLASFVDIPLVKAAPGPAR